MAGTAQRTTKLPNGVTIVTSSASYLPKVSIDVHLGYGSSDDPQDAEGLAQLLGTVILDIERDQSKAPLPSPVRFDVTTGLMETVLRAETSAERENVRNALEKMGRALGDLNIGDRQFGLEKRRLYLEIGHHSDNPKDHALSLVQHLAFPHTAQASPFASPDGILGISKGDLRRFAREEYGPSNIVVEASGPIDHEEFVHDVEAAFSGLALRSSRHFTDPLPQMHDGLAHAGNDFFHQTYFSLAFSYNLAAGVSPLLADRTTVLLNRAMFDEIRQRTGLTYGVDIQNIPLRSAIPGQTGASGLFCLSSHAHPELSGELVARVCDVLARPFALDLKEYARVSGIELTEKDEADVRRLIGSLSGEHIALASVGPRPPVRDVELIRTRLKAEPLVDAGRSATIPVAASPSGLPEPSPARAGDFPVPVETTTNGRFGMTRLSNGLTIATANIDDDFSMMAEVAVYVGAGSLDDPRGKSGLAHLNEHLAFSGTKSRDSKKIEQEMASIHGRLTASTSPSRTLYRAPMFQRPDFIAKGIEILGDVLTHPLLPEERVEHEKAVIRSEEGLYHDDIERFVAETLVRKACPGVFHDAAPEHDIVDISRTDLQEFIASHCTGERTIVAVAGPVAHDTVVNAVARAFVDIPEGQRARTDPPVAEFTERQDHVHDESFKVTHFSIGLLQDSITAEKSTTVVTAFRVLNRLLAKDLQDKTALTDRVQARIHFFERHPAASAESAVVTIESAAYPEDTEQLTDEICTFLASLRDRPLGKELTEIVEQEKSSLKPLLGTGIGSGPNTLRTALGEVIEAARHGNAFEPEHEVARLEALTEDDIRAVLVKLIDGPVAVRALGPSGGLPPIAKIKALLKGEQSAALFSAELGHHQTDAESVFRHCMRSPDFEKAIRTAATPAVAFLTFVEKVNHIRGYLTPESDPGQDAALELARSHFRTSRGEGLDATIARLEESKASRGENPGRSLADRLNEISRQDPDETYLRNLKFVRDRIDTAKQCASAQIPRLPNAPEENSPPDLSLQ